MPLPAAAPPHHEAEDKERAGPEACDGAAVLCSLPRSGQLMGMQHLRRDHPAGMGAGGGGGTLRARRRGWGRRGLASVLAIQPPTLSPSRSPLPKVAHQAQPQQLRSPQRQLIPREGAAVAHTHAVAHHGAVVVKLGHAAARSEGGAGRKVRPGGWVGRREGGRAGLGSQPNRAARCRRGARSAQPRAPVAAAAVLGPDGFVDVAGVAPRGVLWEGGGRGVGRCGRNAGRVMRWDALG